MALLSSPLACDHSRALHPELLLCAFDCLPQEDLLSAAKVCHLWRTLALQHSNHFYHLALVVDLGMKRDDVWLALKKFCADVHYLHQQNLRASLAVDWSRNTFSYVMAYDSAGRPMLKEQPPSVETALTIYTVMDAVREALPIVSKLKLVFGTALEAGEAVCPYLCDTRAPELREFSIRVTSNPSFGDENCATIHPDLFAGTAPKLSRIDLDTVKVDHQRIAAFAAVKVASLYRVDVQAHLPTLLPRVQQLTIDRVPAEDLKLLHSVPGPLRRLTISVDCTTTVTTAVLQPLAAVPDINISLVANDDVPCAIEGLSLASFFEPRCQLNLTLQLCNHGDSVVQVVLYDSNSRSPEDAAFLRAFGFVGWKDDGLCAVLVSTLRPLAPRIMKAAMDDSFLDLLPQLFVDLPALQTLHVQWGRCDKPSSFSNISTTGGNRLHCPKLSNLKLSKGAASSAVRVEVNAEQLQRVLRPEVSVLQQFSSVEMKQILVQNPQRWRFHGGGLGRWLPRRASRRRQGWSSDSGDVLLEGARQCRHGGVMYPTIAFM
ncbi:hypothetical protein EXIGLDRAFT_42938 [Exidia glandulosa HHB12029]|uniref:F-box domain-containing protein n=1 Tax=Exidia glandulosa HHB12029 TaxID=1314781 RepID=A0A166AMN2_EXIGL|nr:hypothetical protein EXIGLDRAFT_42938 [Exidia glandulosa HHB12029]